MSKRTADIARGWPAGESQMARRLRAHDWSATPLGPVDGWPVRLRAAVELMLALPQPGYIGWGPQLISLYNDPYIPVLGDKHPDALGRSYHEVWREIDAAYRTALDATLSGHAQLFVDEPMPLAGRGRDTSWFTFSWTPLHDDDGRVGGFLTVGLETTEKVLAEQALAESEVRARSLLDTFTQALWEADADGRIRVDSPSWRAFTGQSAEAWLGSQWADALHPDDRERVEREWAAAVAAARPVDSEYRLRDAAGEWRWTHVRAVPLLDDHGAVRKWIGMNVDIDARRRAEERTRVSEHRLRLAAEASGIGTWVWYPAADTSECDDRTCELLAYPPGTPITLARAFAERLHPDDAAAHVARLQAAIQRGSDGRVHTDFRVVLPGGQVRWITVRARTLFDPGTGGAVCMSGSLEDVTARKRYEAGLAFLAEFERRLAFGTDPDAIARTAAEAIAGHFDATHCLLVDIDPEAQIARVGWDHRVPGCPDLRGEYRLPESHTPGELARLRGGEPVTIDDVRADCDPARAAEIEGYGVRALATMPCIRDARWVFAISVQYDRPHAWDADEVALLRQLVDRLWMRIERARADAGREAANAALARQTRFIEGMLGSLPDYAYAFDREHRFVYTNRAMQALFLRSGEEMAGCRFTDLDYPPDLAARLDAQIDQVFATGGTVEDEIFYVTPDGTAAFFQYLWGPVFDADGRVELVVGTSRDTTARRRLEDRLRTREAHQAFRVRIADALRDLDDPLRIQAEVTRLLAGHLGAQRVLFAQLDGDEVIVEHDHVEGVPSIVGRYPAAAFGAAYPEIYGRGEMFMVDDVTCDARLAPPEVEVFRRMGIAAFASGGIREDGRVAAILSVHTDRPRAWTVDEAALVREVGERVWAAIKRADAERALRESERRFRMLADSLDDVFYMTDLVEGRLDYLSASYERIWGRARGSLRTDLAAIADTLHPDDRERFAEAKARQQRGEALDTEYRIVRPDGGVRWISDRCFPVPGAEGRLSAGIARDITERKAIEAAREASERLLRQFSEASSDVLWIRDAANLRWEFLSPAYTRVYGEPLDTALASGGLGHWAGHVLDADRPRALESIERMRAGEPLTFEYRIRRVGDGAVRWIRDTGFPLFDPDGCVHRVGGIGHDVTDLKHAQAALAQSEDRQRRLVQGIPQLVWRATPEGLCTWVSPQWPAFTGQDENTALGLGWAQVVHPDDLERTLAAVEAARTDGRMDVENRLRRADGQYVWHHVRSSPRLDADGRIVEWLGTCTDVQQLKELQEQQDVLVAELQHRTRNLIGVIRALADRTLAGSESLEGFREQFGDRLAALARVQGLLSAREAGQRITFDRLIRTELAGLGVLDAGGHGDRVELCGPRGVRLRSATVQTFALGLHELGTNAMKYGALSRPGGRLRVHWEVDTTHPKGPRLRVEWSEHGVDVPEPAPGQSRRRGYGRELIERALPYQLQAETRYELGPDGVRCTISLPLAPGWEPVDGDRKTGPEQRRSRP